MILSIKHLFVLLFLSLLTACATGNRPVGIGSNTNNAVLDRARAHTNLGAAYLQKNRLEIALDEFSQAVQIMPSYAMAYNGLGMVRSALGQDEEAEYNFKKAIDLDPSISESHNNYGTFLCSRGRYDESITQFLTAVQNPLYTTPHLAYANAGICAERGNDIKSAERYLNKALEIQPLTHSAAHKLAEIQFKRGDVVSAKKTMQNAIVASPNAEMLWLGVQIEQKLGDRNNEASYALELRKRFPNSKETKLLLNRK
ncbi:MAG: type IV pilus biogenesis/stability protein PilW [Methylophilaceae bacterium]